jgi:transcription initiation factor TFIID subunit 9B
MATVAQSQTNGAPSQPSQPSQPTQATNASGSTTLPNTQNSAFAGSQTTPAPTPTATAAAHAPRPRDSRIIELLLTSQGVTSFDSRVPLVLLDFAYRHTSSILNDALHLSNDPYTTHAGSKPSGSSGAAPTAPPGSDATVSNNAVALAIASRQAYQFRGGGGGGGGAGGGASKEWLAEMAQQKNKVQLPRILANEWGTRLPGERFVLSGVGWGLKDQWDAGADSSDEDEDEDADEMQGVEADASGTATKDGAEEGGLEDFLGDDLGDEDMEGME